MSQSVNILSQFHHVVLQQWKKVIHFLLGIIYVLKIWASSIRCLYFFIIIGRCVPFNTFLPISLLTLFKSVLFWQKFIYHLTSTNLLF